MQVLSTPSDNHALTTSLAIPITCTVREAGRRSSRPPEEYSAVVTSKLLPMGSSSGQKRRAVDWLITATAALEAASSVVNARPRTSGMSSAEKYSGDTSLYLASTRNRGS